MKEFEIIPPQKIGSLILGSSLENNKNLTNIYGEISYQNSLAGDEDSINAAAELLFDSIDEAEKWKAEQREYDKYNRQFYKVLYENKIELFYKNENLVEITVYKECENLNFNDHYLFKESPKDIIDLFCDTLLEYPLIKKQDIYFPKNHMTFWAFSEDVTSDGKVIWANERSEFYSEKSFAMYAGPRNDDQTYDDYIVYKPALLK